MREFLFRGKRTDKGEWAESQYPFGVMHSGTVVEDFDPQTVGQYTGLKDANGKKIFEGDILKLKFEVLGLTKIVLVQMMWCDGSWSWGTKSPEAPAVQREASQSEIVGNIHDNPELLEVPAHA